MRNCFFLLLLVFVVGCSAPGPKNAPCKMFAYHTSRSPVHVVPTKTMEFDGAKYFFYKLTRPFDVTPTVQIPAGTQLAATIPFNWCKYQTVQLIRLPGFLSWFPAQAVIMPNKRESYFSMLTVPANAKCLPANRGAVQDGKTFVHASR